MTNTNAPGKIENDEDALRSDDDGLVDTEIVRDINQLIDAARLGQAMAIGKILLERYFDGNYEAFRNPSRSKRVSFNALCRDSRLRWSAHKLRAAVHIYEQSQGLPKSIADALSFGHHEVLLTVRDDERKVALARQAALDGLTVEQTREAARAGAPDGPRVGRKALSPAYRDTSAALRALERVVPRDVASAEALGELPQGRRQDLLRAALEVMAGMHLLVAALEGPVA